MKKIYFIVGPTASGKTGLSIKLAKEIEKETGRKSEIISADSRQIFKDLNISTGKVTTEEMGNIPHHLLDIAIPGEYFSVYDFERIAIQKINEIQSRDNVVIICGGTGFYIDSILFEQNLPNVEKDENLRKELKDKSNLELFEILKNIPPLNLPQENRANFSPPYKGGDLEQFKNLITKYSHPEFKNNKQRLIRTIEIITKLGYFPEQEKKLRFSDFEIIYIKPSKEKLEENVKIRLEKRLEEKMVEEIKNAIEKYKLTKDNLKNLGFEFYLTWQYLNNEIDFEKYKELFFIQELQYTKRQKTWFNKYEKLKLPHNCSIKIIT